MRVAAATLLLLVAGCATPPESTTPAPAETGATPTAERSAAGLPAGFAVREQRSVEEAFLAPEAAWRALVSRLTTLRADAMAGGEAILVSFEAQAMHATDGSGRRRTWLLPEGLLLLDPPRHLLLGLDGSTAVYDAAGVQVATETEVTVVRALLHVDVGEEQEIRLVVKDGSTFRSIQTAG